MHHLRLDNIQRRIREISEALVAAERLPDSEDAVRAMLAERIQLDREKSELAKYFGSTIIPTE